MFETSSSRKTFKERSVWVVEFLLKARKRQRNEEIWRRVCNQAVEQQSAYCSVNEAVQSEWFWVVGVDTKRRTSDILIHTEHKHTFKYNQMWFIYNEALVTKMEAEHVTAKH